MKTVFVVAAITVAVNLVVLFSEPGVGILFIPVIELITGILLAISDSQKQKGQGILLGLALSLLIGFLVCTRFFTLGSVK
jgi:hypothetical protein